MIRATGRLICAAAIGTLLATSAFPVGALAGNCFGLSASDCRLVVTAGANIAKETSFNFALDFSLKTSGISQGDSTTTVKGSGVLAFDPQALQNLPSNPTPDFSKILKGTVH